VEGRKRGECAVLCRHRVTQKRNDIKNIKNVIISNIYITSIKIKIEFYK
jgi:hypothetical protein